MNQILWVCEINLLYILTNVDFNFFDIWIVLIILSLDLIFECYVELYLIQYLNTVDDNLMRCPSSQFIIICATPADG